MPDIPATGLGAHGSGGENNHNPLSTQVFGEENNLLTRGPDSGDRQKPTKTDKEQKDDQTRKGQKTAAAGKQTKRRQKRAGKADDRQEGHHTGVLHHLLLVGGFVVKQSCRTPSACAANTRGPFSLTGAHSE